MNLITKHFNKDGTRILVVSDMHLKAYNPKNRKNYTKELLSYLDRLIAVTEEEKIDILIFLGDIYDREFLGKHADHIHQSIIARINHIKNNGVTVYTLMGNHEKHALGRGTSFFMNIDWESNRIREQFIHDNLEIPPYFTPTYQVCDQLIINDFVCIHMHHFNDVDKSYRSPSTTYPKNFGLFHDAILPTQARKKVYTLTESDLAKYSSVTYSDEIFANLDEAVLGDIHARIGEMQVQTSTGICQVDIPGAIGRNSSSITESHESVELPIFTIYKDSYTKTHYTFQLWSYKDSFKQDYIIEQKQKQADMKQLTQVLNQSVQHCDFVKDKADFPEHVQVIVDEILYKGCYIPKTHEQTIDLLRNFKID